MKRLFLYLVLILLLSCNKGIWITEQTYRPKHPTFSIPRKPFKSNSLINSNYIYISTKRFVNWDGNILIGYMGFYDDGKLIVDGSWENELLTSVRSRNSCSTACSIGYYTTEDDKIEIEYFWQLGGGHYETRKGIIKKDTIIFIESILGITLKREIRCDTLVRSSYGLK